MAKKTLSVDLPEELSDNFIKTVTEVGGRWRSQRPEETFTSAVESAVVAALMLFLQGLDGKHELPDFREYTRLKYPELSEDMITTIANLIERETGGPRVRNSAAMKTARTIPVAYKNRRGEGAEQMSELKLFDQLPKDYRDAVNHIVENVLGDESPEMNDAFRVLQAEIFLAGALAEDRKPDLKLFEIEALAFRGGWERRKRISGAPV